MAKHIRTKEEELEDFVLCCAFLEKGYTWQEIRAQLKQVNSYNVSIKDIKESYATLLLQEASQTTASDELQRAIEDLDALMYKAIEGYNNSKGIHRVIRTKQELPDNLGDLLGETSPRRLTVTEKSVTKEKRNGDTKYLTLWLKAFEKKAELMKWGKVDIFDLATFLKDYVLDDGQGQNVASPIRSEKEAIAFDKVIAERYGK